MTVMMRMMVRMMMMVEVEGFSLFLCWVLPQVKLFGQELAEHHEGETNDGISSSWGLGERKGGIR